MNGASWSGNGMYPTSSATAMGMGTESGDVEPRRQ